MGGFECTSCSKSIGRYDEYLECHGDCKARFHIGCVGVTVEVLMDMKRSGDVKSWCCSGCLTSPRNRSQSLGDSQSLNTVNNIPFSRDSTVTNSSSCSRCDEIISFFSKAIKNLEQKMLREMLSFKTQVVDEIKAALDKNTAKIDDVEAHISTSISKSMSRQANSLCEKPSTVGGYAQAASKKCSVVIKPKDDKQSNVVTKTDLLHCVDPVTSEVGVSGVKHIRGGGILVSCPTRESAETLSKEVTDKLSDKYTVQEARKLNPRIRVVGLSERHAEDTFLNYLRVQNSKILEAASDIKLVSFDTVKGKGKHGEASDGGRRVTIYQAVIQLDPGAYERALSAGRLFVGYDCCVVYDALDLLRCYKCSGFGHVSSSCKAKPACPRCSGDHLVTDCTSQSLKCVNCFNASKIIPNISCNHAAWDRECVVYRRKLKLLREDVLGLK